MLEIDNYIDKRVKIMCSHKTSYNHLIGKKGVVERTSTSQIGIKIDGTTNKSSSYGLYWFKPCEVEIIENSGEENMLDGFKHVAIVNLYEDAYGKDYAFALYDEEFEEILRQLDRHSDAYVVVNSRTESNKVLAKVKNIFIVEEYNGTKVTKQVVGVVNMDGYNKRKDEEKRIKEVKERRDALKKELDAEIKKKMDLLYYKEMAEKYPELAAMVSELEALGE